MKVLNLHYCLSKIATLLQAFGLSIRKCGLANVLQCGLGFLSEGRKKQNNSVVLDVSNKAVLNSLTLTDTNWLPQASISNHVRVVILFALPYL